MSRRATFDPRGIWFVVEIDKTGEVVYLEEHDWREGGGISADRDKTLEQTFLDHAYSRYSKDDGVRADAEAFLVRLRAGVIDEPKTREIGTLPIVVCPEEAS